MLNKVPSNPEEAIEFIDGNFISIQKFPDLEPQDYVLKLTIHDLLSAFSYWDEWNGVSKLLGMRNTSVEYLDEAHRKLSKELLDYVLTHNYIIENFSYHENCVNYKFKWKTQNMAVTFRDDGITFFDRDRDGFDIALGFGKLYHPEKCYRGDDIPENVWSWLSDVSKDYTDFLDDTKKVCNLWVR